MGLAPAGQRTVPPFCVLATESEARYPRFCAVGLGGRLLDIGARTLAERPPSLPAPSWKPLPRVAPRPGPTADRAAQTFVWALRLLTRTA